MGSVAFRIQGAEELRSTLERVSGGIRSFPSGNNPLLRWRDAYGSRTIRSAEGAPTVGQSANFRGSVWPKLKPAYVRKDGTVVPVWGGIERVRAGRVTRARGDSPRTLKYLTKEQRKGMKAGSNRLIQKGDLYTGGTVLGKLRGDSGARYKASDRQLYATGGLMFDWSKSAPLVADAGRSVTVTSSKPYAAKQHAMRPFAWSPQIEREESESVLKHVSQYIDQLFRQAGR